MSASLLRPRDSTRPAKLSTKPVLQAGAAVYKLEAVVTPMQYRYLGQDRLKVSAVGYGCPTFAGRLGGEEEMQAIAVIHRALDLGLDFIDPADHNDGNNEELLAKALKGRRGRAVLATKFGNLRGRPGAGDRLVDGRPEYAAAACEASLR